MASFTPFKFTAKGLELEYKAQFGQPLRFSKFVLGDGYNTDSIRDLNNLVNVVREEPITRMQITGSGDKKKIVLGFDLDTTELTTGFYLREIGIMAIDPDTQEEILMFYTNAGETADYIVNDTSSTVTTKLINAEIYITDVEEITATIDSSLVYATQSDLDGKVDKITGKGLSTNDFTDEDKQKLDNLPEEIVVEETDPTVPQHVKNIQQTDITNWNNKAEVSQIPVITYSTQELESGVSSLATGQIHLTYE